MESPLRIIPLKKNPTRTNARNGSKPISVPVFKEAMLEEIPIIRDDLFAYPKMNTINLFKISERAKPLFDNSFILNKSELFDKEWIVKSENYVKSLSIEDKATILAYTHRGDEYVNNYFRDPKFPENLLKDKMQKEKIKFEIDKIFKNDIKNEEITNGFPLFVQLFKLKNIPTNDYFQKDGIINANGYRKASKILQSLKINKDTQIETSLKILIPYIESFASDLKRIIQRGPKLTKPLKVFRAVGSDYLTESTVLKGFTSTSISLDKALDEFGKYNSSGNYINLYEIIINSDIPCIFLPSDYTWPGKLGAPEFEVLLDSDINAIPSDVIFKKMFNPPANKCYINQNMIMNSNLEKTKKDQWIELYKKNFNNYSYAELISLIEFRNISNLTYKTRTITLEAANSSLGAARNGSKPISMPVFKEAMLEEIPIIRDDVFVYPEMTDISLFKLSKKEKTKELIDNNMVLDKSELFDKEWILKSEKYVNNLSAEDKATILGYTHTGSEYVNNYLRDPNKFPQNIFSDIARAKDKKSDFKYDIDKIFDKYNEKNNNGKPLLPIKGFPLFVQLFKMNKIDTSSYFDKTGNINANGYKKAAEILEKKIGITKDTTIENSLKKLIPYIKLFAEDLKRIIDKGPRVTKPHKVYRAIDTDYLTGSTVLKDFTSTTISLNRVEKGVFGKPNNDNNMLLYEIIINPKIACIFLPPKNTWPGILGRPEFEVLIDSDITANSSKDVIFKKIFNPPSNKCYINENIVINLNMSEEKKKEYLDLLNPQKGRNNYSFAELISLIEFKNISGQNYKTRTITLEAAQSSSGVTNSSLGVANSSLGVANSSGGRRRTRYNRKMKNKTHKKYRI